MKNSLAWGAAAAGILFLLVYMALFIKLVSLGTTPFSGNIGPAALPVGHIENSPAGFTVQNGIGSLVIPLLAGAVVGVGHYLMFKHK